MEESKTEPRTEIATNSCSKVCSLDHFWWAM